MVAVGAEYLDLAVESALEARRCGTCWFRLTRPSTTNADDVERAQARLRDAGMSVTVAPLAEIIDVAARCRKNPDTPAAATTGSR